MPKDENSVVKSFRTTEDKFNEANEIFKKEGFNFSEVIRLLIEATIREGRIPRGLSTKSMEKDLDKAKKREKYIDSLLDLALPRPGNDETDPKERLLNCIFGEPAVSKNMSNKALRDWANKWGLPDNLSISTIADLHDCGLLSDDPWFGDYDYEIEDDSPDEHLLILQRFGENVRDNLEQVKRKLQIKAMKTLMEYDIEKDDDEEEKTESQKQQAIRHFMESGSEDGLEETFDSNDSFEENEED